MDIKLTAHFEDFIVAANALRHKARNFEALNDRLFDNTETRLDHKVRSLRQLAHSIDEQVREFTLGGKTP